MPTKKRLTIEEKEVFDHLLTNLTGEHGVSKKDLATTLGFSPQNLSTGRYGRISPEKAARVLKTLELTAADKEIIKTRLPAVFALLNEETTNQ